MNIGERIKAARLRNKLTQKQLSELSGVSKAVVFKYENNQAEPSATNLFHIAQTLGTTTDYLIGGRETFDKGAYDLTKILIEQIPDHQKEALHVIYKAFISANNLDKKLQKLMAVNE